MKRSNSSWMTKVATPADLGSSRTLDKPGGGGGRARGEESGLEQGFSAGTADIGAGPFSVGASWALWGVQQPPWPHPLGARSTLTSLGQLKMSRHMPVPQSPLAEKLSEV